jgi:hypothetical protein
MDMRIQPQFLSFVEHTLFHTARGAMSPLMLDSNCKTGSIRADCGEFHLQGLSGGQTYNSSVGMRGMHNTYCLKRILKMEADGAFVNLLTI